MFFSNRVRQYKKAITAISSLDYKITADNAKVRQYTPHFDFVLMKQFTEIFYFYVQNKGLGKGKSKLAGIGKGTCEYFLFACMLRCTL
jgi:hypothetical protein